MVAPMVGLDAITRPATFALTFNRAACDQVGDRGVPLAVGDAGGGEDVSFGVPVGMGFQVFTDDVGWADAIVGAGFGGFEVVAIIGWSGIEFE